MTKDCNLSKYIDSAAVDIENFEDYHALEAVA
jgi:hypothetical protein